MAVTLNRTLRCYLRCGPCCSLMQWPGKLASSFPSARRRLASAWVRDVVWLHRASRRGRRREVVAKSRGRHGWIGRPTRGEVVEGVNAICVFGPLANPALTQASTRPGTWGVPLLPSPSAMSWMSRGSRAKKSFIKPSKTAPSDTGAEARRRPPLASTRRHSTSATPEKPTNCKTVLASATSKCASGNPTRIRCCGDRHCPRRRLGRAHEPR